MAVGSGKEVMIVGNSGVGHDHLRKILSATEEIKVITLREELEDGTNLSREYARDISRNLFSEYARLFAPVTMPVGTGKSMVGRSVGKSNLTRWSLPTWKPCLFKQSNPNKKKRKKKLAYRSKRKNQRRK